MKKESFKKKFRKFYKKNSVIILYSIAVFAFIAITGFFVLSLLPPKAQVFDNNDGNSLTNTDKVTVDISKNRISPNEIKIRPQRFYDFTFRKNFETNCTGITIPDLNIRITVEEREKTVPIRINSEGEYRINCVGEDSTAKLIVTKSNS